MESPPRTFWAFGPELKARLDHSTPTGASSLLFLCPLSSHIVSKRRKVVFLWAADGFAGAGQTLVGSLLHLNDFSSLSKQSYGGGSLFPHWILFALPARLIDGIAVLCSIWGCLFSASWRLRWPDLPFGAGRGQNSSQHPPSGGRQPSPLASSLGTPKSRAEANLAFSLALLPQVSVWPVFFLFPS